MLPASVCPAGSSNQSPPSGRQILARSRQWRGLRRPKCRVRLRPDGRVPIDAGRRTVTVLSAVICWPPTSVAKITSLRTISAVLNADPNGFWNRFIAGLAGITVASFGVTSLVRGDSSYSKWFGGPVFAPITVLLGG